MIFMYVYPAFMKQFFFFLLVLSTFYVGNGLTCRLVVVYTGTKYASVLILRPYIIMSTLI